MTDRKPSDGGPGTREQRLAAALRANLRRRKAASSRRPADDAERGKAPESGGFPWQIRAFRPPTLSRPHSSARPPAQPAWKRPGHLILYWGAGIWIASASSAAIA